MGRYIRQSPRKLKTLNPDISETRPQVTKPSADISVIHLGRINAFFSIIYFCLYYYLLLYQWLGFNF